VRVTNYFFQCPPGYVDFENHKIFLRKLKGLKAVLHRSVLRAHDNSIARWD